MSIKIHIEIEGADELLATFDWSKLGLSVDSEPGEPMQVSYVDEAKEAELQRSDDGE